LKLSREWIDFVGIKNGPWPIKDGCADFILNVALILHALLVS
jgi:hypothetical protein